ncbi:MAG: circularly permuted type 2 ATP-grasp protein [Chloroflexi bacterium]|nr:circularly permuted type 2 ATP-grasp protein [Chloroflexota bacterium]MDA1010731.1 circularly permuted type 2 ATP-grasp protein [Chloroflexota bacterium]
MSSLFEGYLPGPGPDEMFTADGQVRPAYRAYHDRIDRWDSETYLRRQSIADIETLNGGITFTVYDDDAGTERIFPFSLVPRIIAPAEWSMIEQGLQQRVTVLNAFLDDIYGEQRCIRDGVIPAELVLGHQAYRSAMAGFSPPLGVHAHIAGIDLIRDRDGVFRVLEDNLRTPSGVSYVIENRRTMLNAVPDLFPRARVEAVDDYAEHLAEMMIAVRPSGVPADQVRAVILTPGAYNSAYFEHSFLARQMGVELVEGRDLVVDQDRVYLRSTSGLERVDVIYRRVDDDFLDPEVFREDSELGVHGLMRAYLAGNVTIVNAVGAGVADDKTTYRFVPDLIRYFRGEEPIIPNVDTFTGWREDDVEYILDNLEELVLKPSDGSGGYGIIVGPQASRETLDIARQRVRENPRAWIAQPLQEFSTIPSFNGERFEPRRADLRPFIVTGESSWVLPGGLTRVAANSQSYIVNSSQGGGSKDTWVLRTEPEGEPVPFSHDPSLYDRPSHGGPED